MKSSYIYFVKDGINFFEKREKVYLKFLSRKKYQPLCFHNLNNSCKSQVLIVSPCWRKNNRTLKLGTCNNELELKWILYIYMLIYLVIFIHFHWNEYFKVSFFFYFSKLFIQLQNSYIQFLCADNQSYIKITMRKLITICIVIFIKWHIGPMGQVFIHWVIALHTCIYRSICLWNTCNYNK